MCHICGNDMDSEHIVNGIKVCNYCYTHFGRVCDDCGMISISNWMGYEYGHRMCPQCFYKKYKKYPAHYNGKNMFFYLKKQKTPLYIGVELEINGVASSNFSEEVMKELNQAVIVKVDDSLSYTEGCEVVTKPMTFDYMINQKIWKRIYNLCQKHSMNNTDGCGLHFHLDKKYLSKYEGLLARLDYIINNFVDYWSAIGGRNYLYDDWCEAVEKNDNEWGVDSGYGRYCAVNFENENTIELRFCKSTANYETFVYRLLNLYLLIEFCKKVKFNLNNTESNFVKAFEKFKQKEWNKYFNQF